MTQNNYRLTDLNQYFSLLYKTPVITSAKGHAVERYINGQR